MKVLEKRSLSRYKYEIKIYCHWGYTLWENFAPRRFNAEMCSILFAWWCLLMFAGKCSRAQEPQKIYSGSHDVYPSFVVTDWPSAQRCIKISLNRNCRRLITHTQAKSMAVCRTDNETCCIMNTICRGLTIYSSTKEKTTN